MKHVKSRAEQAWQSLPGRMGPILAIVATLAMGMPAALQAQSSTSGVPAMKPPLASTPSGPSTPSTPGGPAKPQAAPKPGEARTIAWEALVPPDWDPFKEFKGVNFALLDDGDPRAMQMLKRMREVWDNAPINKTMVGQTVRIPGFVVPLEDSKEGLKEFLLVPYYGACVHSPPPPSNQIIHVLTRKPAKGLRSMDTVWISGPLASHQTESFMGVASYRMEAAEVAPYAEKPK